MKSVVSHLSFLLAQMKSKQTLIFCVVSFAEAEGGRDVARKAKVTTIIAFSDVAIVSVRQFN